jgi:hypothetical protein
VKTTTFRCTFHSDDAVSTGAGLGSPPTFAGVGWRRGPAKPSEVPRLGPAGSIRNLWVTGEALDRRLHPQEILRKGGAARSWRNNAKPEVRDRHASYPFAASTGCNLATRRSKIEIVRALPLAVASDSEYHRATLQEATLPLGPFPLPGATRSNWGVEGAFKQAKRSVRLCRAEQVKYARLQHRLE